jgi:hypothetical protein
MMARKRAIAPTPARRRADELIADRSGRSGA